MPRSASVKKPAPEVESLRRRLTELEETLRAIQEGQVDALVMRGPRGPQIYTLKSADLPYRLLVEAMSEAALIVSRTGVILHANASFGTLVDRPADRVLGMRLAEFAALEDQSQLLSLLQRGIQTPVHSEMTFLDRQGGRLLAKVSVAAMVLEDAPALSVVITDLRVREEIREHIAARRRLTFLAEASRLLTGTLDPSEMLVLIARLALNGIADWCEIDLRDEKGTLRRATIAHRDPAKTAWAEKYLKKHPVLDESSAAWRAYQNGNSVLYPVIREDQVKGRNSKSGAPELVNELGLESAMVVPMKGRQGTIGVISFVSTDPGHVYGEADLHMAESLAIRAGLSLENSTLYRREQDAVQAREQFLSIASHELRTPMTTLQIQLQHALRKLRSHPDAAAVRDLVPMISSASLQSDILVQMIDRLLDLASIRSGKITLLRERVQLEETVRSVIHRLREHSIHSGTQLRFRGVGVEGHWDRVRIEEIVTNLVTNAIKYGEAKPVDVSIEASDGKARLIVRDSGIGMDAEFLTRIFTPFEQARSGSGIRGLGLGLYITQQLVKAHGGTIRVDSTRGVGSTFTVELPILPTEPPV